MRDCKNTGDLFAEERYGEAEVDPTARQPDQSGALVRRFVVPPFSVLDSKAGYWRERKAAWLSLGLASELGRDLQDTSWSSSGAFAEAVKGRHSGGAGGGSIFDPVLCEIMYRWFAPPEGEVLDPFAGGSVRGVVAHKLGMSYTGIELSQAQVTANRVQGDLLTPQRPPVWLRGDSREVLDKLGGSNPPAPSYDMVFTCPPYFDLEVYGDDPKDLSPMSWPQFVDAYQAIVRKAVAHLVPNRFSVWVVSDVRGPDGVYRDLRGLTVQAHERAGMLLYNEAILLTNIGSLPVRVNKSMAATRKLGRAHQSVLVFVKGDARKAAEDSGYVVADWVGWSGVDEAQMDAFESVDSGTRT